MLSMTVWVRGHKGGVGKGAEVLHNEMGVCGIDSAEQ